MRRDPIFNVSKIVGRYKPEKRLSMQVARYIRRNYKDVIFSYDIASDLPLKPHIAKRLRMEYMHEKGHPDLSIYEARGGYAGLVIELKVRAKVTEEQTKTLHMLSGKGYFCLVGKPHNVFQYIDWYMSLPLTFPNTKDTFINGI